MGNKKFMNEYRDDILKLIDERNIRKICVGFTKNKNQAHLLYKKLNFID
jgi:hypothetical protein